LPVGSCARGLRDCHAKRVSARLHRDGAACQWRVAAGDRRHRDACAQSWLPHFDERCCTGGGCRLFRLAVRGKASREGWSLPTIPHCTSIRFQAG
jgi:hypothetical protein